MTLRRVVPIGMLILCLAICVRAQPPQPTKKAAEAKEKNPARYLRMTKDENGLANAMEVAIARFVPRQSGKKTPAVDLIAVVHIADASFYDKLNERFKQYDAVLYELVAPQGTRVPKGATPSGSPVSKVQNSMTKLLDLEFQLKGIDYHAKNLVHADMSREEFSKSMRDRGESLWPMFLRAFGYAMAQQSKDPAGAGDVRLLLAFFDKNRALALKRVVAEQFEDFGGAIDVIDGPDGSTLISQRNKRALAVLREQIAAGKKRIAIFYGAGHMPDFQRRLCDDFHLRRASTEWIVAWDLTEK